LPTVTDLREYAQIRLPDLPPRAPANPGMR
jgi:hypothetical protein